MTSTPPQGGRCSEPCVALLLPNLEGPDGRDRVSEVAAGSWWSKVTPTPARPTINAANMTRRCRWRWPERYGHGIFLPAERVAVEVRHCNSEDRSTLSARAEQRAPRIEMFTIRRRPDPQETARTRPARKPAANQGPQTPSRSPSTRCTGAPAQPLGWGCSPDAVSPSKCPPPGQGVKSGPIGSKVPGRPPRPYAGRLR